MHKGVIRAAPRRLRPCREGCKQVGGSVPCGPPASAGPQLSCCCYFGIVYGTDSSDFERTALQSSVSLPVFHETFPSGVLCSRVRKVQCSQVGALSLFPRVALSLRHWYLRSWWAGGLTQCWSPSGRPELLPAQCPSRWHRCCFIIPGSCCHSWVTTGIWEEEPLRHSTNRGARPGCWGESGAIPRCWSRGWGYLSCREETEARTHLSHPGKALL